MVIRLAITITTITGTAGIIVTSGLAIKDITAGNIGAIVDGITCATTAIIKITVTTNTMDIADAMDLAKVRAKDESMATAFPSEDTAMDAVRVWSLVQSIKTGILSGDCSDARGKDMDVRPMRGRFDEHPDAIWFIVPREQGYMADPAGQERLLTFSNGSDGEHVARIGRLFAVTDLARLKALWDSHADVEFPEGAKEANPLLLKFVPLKAQFWTHGGLIGFVINFLEAQITGEPRSIGEHGVVKP